MREKLKKCFEFICFRYMHYRLWDIPAEGSSWQYIMIFYYEIKDEEKLRQKLRAALPNSSEMEIELRVKEIKNDYFYVNYS